MSKVFVPLGSESPDLSHILLKEIEEKSVILPYGYHTDWPPNASSICDMPTCPDVNADKPWKRFDGCWHSFHIDCLRGSTICEICRGQIKRDIRKLSKVASEAIFNPATDNENVNEGENDEMTNPSPKVSEMNDNDVSVQVQKLKEMISKTNPSTPITASSSVSLTSDTSNHKKVHCKTCSHIVQGHKRPKNGPNKCPKCPNGICSTEGKKTKCDCKEHSGDTSSNQGNTSVQNFTISQTGNTTTALLNVSQGDLADGIGSNACTVIAMYTAVKFLQNGIDCPSGNISAQTVTEFTSFMKAGNTIYDIINPPVTQPNLFVEEVIKAVDFPFETPSQSDIIIVADRKSFESELRDALVTSQGKNAVIIIIPMDKSMLLCSNNSHLILFGSHKHNDKGAIIATTSRDNVIGMTDVLVQVSQNDWNTSIVGANIIPLTIRQI